MRRIGVAHPGPRPRRWRSAASAPAATQTPRRSGSGPAYETLGKLPVMHAGRIKPLDTLAREEVKQIFGRETVKLRDADEQGRRDLGARRRAVRLVGPPRVLGRPADHPGRIPPAEAADPGRDDPGAARGGRRSSTTTSAADRGALKTLAADPEISRRRAEAGSSSEPGLAEARTARLIADLAGELSEEHKWLTPRELEEARVTAGGQRLPFDDLVPRRSPSASDRPTRTRRATTS